MITETRLDVILAVIENEEKRWQWISEQVYGDLCEKHGDHLLVRIGKRFDFAEMVKRCQGYRRYCGKEGQEAKHTLEQLCQASVVKAINQWSYERLVLAPLTAADSSATEIGLRYWTGSKVNAGLL